MNSFVSVMARSKDFDEEEILEKAMSVFWHKGYNGTSMQELIDALGISRSSLYDTYGDKHTLYMKTLEFYQANGQREMTNIITNASSAREAVRKLLDLIINGLLKDKQHKGCFMVNAEVEVAAHDKEVKDLVCKGDRQIEDAFRIAILKGQQSNEFSNQLDALALSRFFLNTVKGIRVSARSTTDKAFFEDIVNTTLSVLH